MIICIGSIVGLFGILQFNVVLTDFECTILPWLLGMGFILLFGALFCKTWRISAIFNKKDLKKVVITDAHLIKLLLLLLFIEAINIIRTFKNRLFFPYGL